MAENAAPREANRLGAVQPSASMAVSGMAKKLRAEGKDVIDLGVGEPDFATPEHIIEAAYQAALAGQTKYTPTSGSSAMKQAVAEKYHRENGLAFEPSEIIISNGAKQSLFDALMATVNPGDEVLLCAPYFGSYNDIVKLLGGIPVPITCTAETNFRLTPEALEAAITSKTKWLLLNHPSNPSGATYNTQQLQALGRVLGQHNQVMILADEIYERIVFDQQPFVSFGSACPELADRTLLVNGVSKAYAMTGWRIGYAAGPPDLVTAMATVQSQATSGPSAISQAGAVEALTGDQTPVEEFRIGFERRRDLVVEAVAAIEPLTLATPGGAFYAYIGCRDLIGRTSPDGTILNDDGAVASYLLHSGEVAVVPGAAYGHSPYFRISTASADDILAEAMIRIDRAVANLM